MVANKELQDVWLARHRDIESRNRCKNAFTIKRLLKYLTEAHHLEFSNAVKDQYEATIDFGAHPNNLSLISHLRIEELQQGTHAVELAYLHGFGSTELHRCLVACAEVGITATFIALICAPDHPKRNELNEKALALHSALPQFIETMGLQTSPNDIGPA